MRDTAGQALAGTVAGLLVAVVVVAGAAAAVGGAWRAFLGTSTALAAGGSLATALPWLDRVGTETAQWTVTASGALQASWTTASGTAVTVTVAPQGTTLVGTTTMTPPGGAPTTTTTLLAWGLAPGGFQVTLPTAQEAEVTLTYADGAATAATTLTVAASG